MQSIDVYKVAIWKKKFLLVITIIDDVICGQEVVEKSVSGHFLKQYYLRCHHAKKISIRKTWTIFLHISCTILVCTKKMYSHKKKHVILRWKSDIRMKQEIKKEKEEIKVLPRLLNVSSNKNHFIIVTWVHFFTFFTTNFLYHFFRFLLSIHV